ncbi:OLC1v1024008C2 [Oldenlandia corymbosa var. corymbosa]|uniref:OLC1v1024008C2 n=1 Tax=Oldenlandia corymbosa var. corymbosa TaxID=529605 RepID=A0AAV1C267_OLDCO|nr:OLC1v1024008C2 [Oldenlandia corymbosa var. corymbosa]
MALRHFERMSFDFIHENPDLEDELEQWGKMPEPSTEDHLFMLRVTTYDRVAERLKKAALELKKSIVAETWGSSGQNVADFSLYSGALGTAFLLWKSFQVTNDAEDLCLCSEIVRACDSASLGSRDVSFICGRAGVCALGSVVAKSMGDNDLMDCYVIKLKECCSSKPTPMGLGNWNLDLSDGLLHGRAGYLWACLFINTYLGTETISPVQLAPVIDKIFSNGRKLGRKGGSPLMFQWNGKNHWGAAHGLAGIMHVLMHFNLQENQQKEVKETLLYMIKKRLPSGTYPLCEEEKGDLLVHWCHGAPGVALTLVKAAEFFGDKVFAKAAVDAGKVVWERGLLEHVGICHGISGNAYVFHALYRLTGSPEFRFKAKSFACFLLDRGQKLLAEGEVRGGDHPFSLFEGIGGMAYLFLDMVQPATAKIPAYEV